MQWYFKRLPNPKTNTRDTRLSLISGPCRAPLTHSIICWPRFERRHPVYDGDGQSTNANVCAHFLVFLVPTRNDQCANPILPVIDIIFIYRYILTIRTKTAQQPVVGWPQCLHVTHTEKGTKIESNTSFAHIILSLFALDIFLLQLTN